MNHEMMDCRSEIKKIVGPEVCFSFKPTYDGGAIFACFQNKLPKIILKNLTNHNLPPQGIIIQYEKNKNSSIKIISIEGPRPIKELLLKYSQK